MVTFDDEYALLSYDAGGDTLRIALADPDRVDFDEPVEDVWVFFNAERLGELVGIEASGVSVSRDDGWLDSLMSLVGERLWAVARELIDIGVTVEHRPVTFPDYERSQLATVWKAAHYQLAHSQDATAYTRVAHAPAVVGG